MIIYIVDSCHVETCVLLGRKKDIEYVSIPYEPEKGMFSKEKAKPGTGTYENIKAWILENYGFKVSTLYIAQVKRKHGIIERDNYNKGAEGHRVPECPAEKERMIEEALRHFRLIK